MKSDVTKFSIQGTDQKGAFKVTRRYSDFDQIRSTLMIQWPGLYIPPLPPKKAVVKRFLEVFI